MYQIRRPDVWVPFLAWRWQSSGGFLAWQGKRECKLYGVPSYKGSTFRPESPPRGLTSCHHHSGIWGFSLHVLGDTDIQPIAGCEKTGASRDDLGGSLAFLDASEEGHHQKAEAVRPQRRRERRGGQGVRVPTGKPGSPPPCSGADVLPGQSSARSVTGWVLMAYIYLQAWKFAWLVFQMDFSTDCLQEEILFMPRSYKSQSTMQLNLHLCFWASLPWSHWVAEN